jgi:predicted ester cyclase
MVRRPRGFVKSVDKGNGFDMPVIDIIQFRDGKAVAHWGVMDMGNMLQQLGVGAPPA